MSESSGFIKTYLPFSGMALYQTWIFLSFFDKGSMRFSTTPDEARFWCYTVSLIVLCVSLVAIALKPQLLGRCPRQAAWLSCGLLTVSAATLAFADVSSPLGVACIAVMALTSGAGTALLGTLWAKSLAVLGFKSLVAAPLALIVAGVAIVAVHFIPSPLFGLVAPAASVLLLLQTSCFRQPPEAEPSAPEPGPFRAPKKPVLLTWLFFGLMLGVSLDISKTGSVQYINSVTWLAMLVTTAAAVVVMYVFLVGRADKTAARSGDEPEAGAFGSRETMCVVCMCIAAALFVTVPLMLPSQVAASVNLDDMTSLFSFTLVELLSIFVFSQVAAHFELSVASVYGFGRAGRALGVLLGSLIGWLVTSFTTWDVIAGSRPIVLIVLSQIILVVAFALAVLESKKSNAAAQPQDSQARVLELASGHGLSKRETEVMQLLAKGRTQQRIQEELGIAQSTATTHIQHVYQKLGVHSKQELIDLIEAGSNISA